MIMKVSEVIFREVISLCLLLLFCQMSCHEGHRTGEIALRFLLSLSLSPPARLLPSFPSCRTTMTMTKLRDSCRAKSMLSLSLSFMWDEMRRGERGVQKGQKWGGSMNDCFWCNAFASFTSHSFVSADVFALTDSGLSLSLSL